MSYEAALYELSEETAVSAAVYEAAAVLKTAIAAEPDYIRMLSSPVLPFEARLAGIREALTDAPEIFRNTVLLICEKNEAASLPDILEGFMRLYESEKDILNITVCSAYPLSETLKKRLESALLKRFKKQIKLEYEINPRHLGGLMIKTREFQYDGTVAARLENIAHILSDNTNILLD